jgi:hypothetical protein
MSGCIVGGVLLRLGSWTIESLDVFLKIAAEVTDISARIELISRQFLGVSYGSHTLVGSPEVAETLAVNFEAVDCFTYLDYVEAMRLSRSFEDFLGKLKLVRYTSGIVTHGTRHHFFTDWVGSGKVNDVTTDVGGQATRQILKTLNLKGDGSYLLPGVPAMDRMVHFVGPKMNPASVSKLQTGDYVGIYTESSGLDVSHVGIIVKAGDALNFRHASSVQGRVIDQDFGEYMKGKPGIVVLRSQA